MGVVANETRSGGTDVSNVYLHFNGTCRQTFEFYRSLFGGDFDLITTFGEGPPDFTPPEDERDNVMHVSYRIGDVVLMGSDTPSTFGPPTVMGNNFSLSYAPNGKEEVDDMFVKLSEGGTVTMPPADMFWGAYFGSCTDKFGVNWMLNFENA